MLDLDPTPFGVSPEEIASLHAWLLGLERGGIPGARGSAHRPHLTPEEYTLLSAGHPSFDPPSNLRSIRSRHWDASTGPTLLEHLSPLSRLHPALLQEASALDFLRSIHESGGRPGWGGGNAFRQTGGIGPLNLTAYPGPSSARDPFPVPIPQALLSDVVSHAMARGLMTQPTGAFRRSPHLSLVQFSQGLPSDILQVARWLSEAANLPPNTRLYATSPDQISLPVSIPDGARGTRTAESPSLRPGLRDSDGTRLWPKPSNPIHSGPAGHTPLSPSLSPPLLNPLPFLLQNRVRGPKDLQFLQALEADPATRRPPDRSAVSIRRLSNENDTASDTRGDETGEIRLGDRIPLELQRSYRNLLHEYRRRNPNAPDLRDFRDPDQIPDADYAASKIAVLSHRLGRSSPLTAIPLDVHIGAVAPHSSKAATLSTSDLKAMRRHQRRRSWSEAPERSRALHPSGPGPTTQLDPADIAALSRIAPLQAIEAQARLFAKDNPRDRPLESLQLGGDERTNASRIDPSKIAWPWTVPGPWEPGPRPVRPIRDLRPLNPEGVRLKSKSTLPTSKIPHGILKDMPKPGSGSRVHTHPGRVNLILSQVEALLRSLSSAPIAVRDRRSIVDTLKAVRAVGHQANAPRPPHPPKDPSPEPRRAPTPSAPTKGRPGGAHENPLRALADPDRGLIDYILSLQDLKPSVIHGLRGKTDPPRSRVPRKSRSRFR